MATYFALTIDPLHIGAGGYRLGRVDNTIVRDPSTDLPKVPGSSLSGVCRNYAIYGLEGDEKEKAIACAENPDEKERGNCGQCLICHIFGFANPDKKKGNQIGRVKFFDGHIIAFPVRSMIGPVWVSTAEVLNSLGIKAPTPSQEELLLNFAPVNGHLNLGWLYFKARQDKFSLPEVITTSQYGRLINERLVLCPSWLFAEVVNSNLEVRTSVCIDFKTGAAKPHALFTYEAIPRATLIGFDIVIDENRCNESMTRDKIEGILKNSLRYLEQLGMGGMNTRGFGRIKVLNL